MYVYSTTVIQISSLYPRFPQSDWTEPEADVWIVKKKNMFIIFTTFALIITNMLFEFEKLSMNSYIINTLLLELRLFTTEFVEFHHRHRSRVSAAS